MKIRSLEEKLSTFETKIILLERSIVNLVIKLDTLACMENPGNDSIDNETDAADGFTFGQFDGNGTAESVEDVLSGSLLAKNSIDREIKEDDEGVRSENSETEYEDCEDEFNVKIDGLDFNTPDSFVIDYLNKFGVVVSNTVVSTKYDVGPFKGKFNGERHYQVDFTKYSKQMGTYHIIDGSKVRVFYRGNTKTCGRCHKIASSCPGEAVARNCAAGGGTKFSCLII